MSTEPRRSPLEEDFSLDTAELTPLVPGEPAGPAPMPEPGAGAARQGGASTRSPVTEPVRPVIVIQPPPPRRRWLSAVLPAILLLLAALAVLRYRVGTADWRGLGPGASSGILAARPREAARPDEARTPADLIAAAGAPAVAPAPAPAREPARAPGEPIEAVAVESADAIAAEATPLAELAQGHAPAEVDPGAAPAETVESEDVIVAVAAAVEPDRVDQAGAPVRDFQAARADLFRPMLAAAAAARPDPVAAPPQPNPDVAEPAGAVDSHEVWDDIAQAAQQKAAERAELEGMKRDLLDRDRKGAAQRKLEQTVEEIKKQDDNRRVFLADLKRLMQAGGPNLAESVRSMVDQNGGDASKLAANQPGRAKKLASSADLRHAWVKSLRRMGIAEGVILSDLERAHQLNYAARNGPRSPDEALLRAARDLLDVPVERLGQVRVVPAPAAAPAAPGRPGAGISRRR